MFAFAVKVVRAYDEDGFTDIITKWKEKEGDDFTGLKQAVDDVY